MSGVGGLINISIPGPEVDIRPAKTKSDKLETFAGWVYAAATTIQTDVGAAEWDLFQMKGERREEWETVPKARIPMELKQPNNLMSLQDIFETTTLHLDLAGEAFWHFITGETGNVVGFQILYPHWVTQPIIENGVLTKWRVAAPSAAPKDIPAEDIVFLRYPHPREPLVGASPIEAFILSHELDLYTRGYGATLMKNNAIPALVISSEQEIDDSEAGVIAERWMDRHQQRPGYPGVMGKGANVKVLGLTLDKLGLEVIDKMTRDQVFGTYGVPASKKGLVTDVNRANAESNERTYQRNVILPRLNRIRRAVNDNVLVRIKLDPKKYYFDFANPVSQDKDFQLDRVETGFKMGALTLNTALEELGFEPVPDGDVYYVPQNVDRIPAGSLMTAPPRSERTGDPQDRATHIFEDPQFELVEIRFVHTADSLERTFISQLRSLFSREQKEVVKALRENWTEIVGEQQAETEGLTPKSTNNVHEQTPEVRLYGPLAVALNSMADAWTQVFHGNSLKAAQSGWDLANKQIKNAVDFDEIRENALKRARRWSARRVTDISKTTEKALRRIVIDAIAEGKNVDQVSREIASMYDGFKGPRAARIARTEMTHNINWGQYATAKSTQEKSGQPLAKIWVTILDGHERETHRRAHGQRRRIDERFLVGSASLRWPGDNGPGSEVVNCRCTMAFKKARKPKV